MKILEGMRNPVPAIQICLKDIISEKILNKVTVLVDTSYE
jgi:hypothetical protein